MRYVRTTAPTLYPVSKEDVKANCGISHPDDDALLDRLIKSTVAHLDGRAGTMGYAIMAQSWTAYAPGLCRKKLNGVWKARTLALDPGPVSAITSVKYLDENEVEQTVDSGDYRLGFDEINRAYVIFDDDFSCPSVACREDAWRVVFATGNAAAGDVPEDIRDAIILIVAHRYENRETASVDDLKDIPFGAKALLAKYETRIF